MHQKAPKRLTIIGLPGSGKSTFSIRLGKLLDIPVYHLDTQVLKAGGKQRNKAHVLAVQKEMTAQKSWIIEGCSLSTLEIRFARTDVCIYFHFSRFLCIWRVIKRAIFQDKNLIKTGCANRINWRLIRYIWTFDKEKREGVLALKDRYPSVEFHTFRKPQDAVSFLLRYL